jgi:hypothetical protein
MREGTAAKRGRIPRSLQLGRYDRGRGRWALSWRQCGADLPASIAWQVALGDWLQRSLRRAYTVLGDGIGISGGRADGTNVGLHSRTLVRNKSQRNTTEQPRTCGSAQGWDGASAQVSVKLSGCTHSVHRWRRWRNGKRKSATSGSEAASGDTMVQGSEDLWARPMGSQRGCNPNRSVARDASQSFEPR